MTLNSTKKWASTAIKWVTQVRYGLGQPPPPSIDGIPIIRATNIHRGKIVTQGLIRADIKDLPLDRTPLLKAGEILVVRSGAYTGDSALVTPEWEGSAPGYDLRITPIHVDSRFLAYTMLSAPVAHQINIVSSRAAQPHLNAEELGDIRIPLPPIEEQRRIADFLDAETRLIDRMVTLREQQISLLRDHYTVAITEHVVPGSTTASRRSDVWPWLPADLRIGRLGYFARIQTGVTVDASRTVSEDDVEVPYLRVANVQDEHIDLSEIKTIRIPKRLARKSTLRAGDVVMTEANGNPDNLGRGAVWDGSIPRMVHQNHIFSIRTDNDRLLPEHLAFLLASAHGRRYFRFTSNQVGIATTSSSKVLGFPIPVLGIDEQRKAVDACTRLRARSEQAVRALQRQIDLLIERRSSLITAAVTGRIDVSTARGSAR